MDPTKPGSKPSVRNLPASQTPAARAAPKASFEETLAARTKKPGAVPEAQSGRSTVLAAIGQADGSASADEVKFAEEQLSLQLARSILQAPKAGKIDIDRAENPNDDDDEG